MANEPTQADLLFDAAEEICTRTRLKNVVRSLADRYAWNWTHGASDRDAADRVLALLAKNGLIEHYRHPFGGDIWLIGGEMFGRTDNLPAGFFPTPPLETAANRLRAG